MTTVLIADRDRDTRRTTAAALRFGGYRVEAARSLASISSLLRSRQVGAVIVDPIGDEPVEAISALRDRTDAPIIIVSDVTAEGDKVALLDAGADDYLTKPFGVEELLARLRAVLRRTSPPAAPPSTHFPAYTLSSVPRPPQ